MSTQLNSSPRLPGSATRSRRRANLRRWLAAATPAVVWLLAIVGAVALHHRGGRSGSLPGYAESTAVALSHPEAGVAREVHVRLFDRVKAGQLLVSLDDHAHRIQLAAAEADVRRLEAEVGAAAAEHASDNARAGAEFAERLRGFAIDRESAHVAWLSAMVGDAADRAALRGLEVELEIERRLHEGGDSAFRELNRIETEVATVAARVQENVAALERMRLAFHEADRRWATFSAGADPAVDVEATLAPLRLAIEVRARDVQQLIRGIDAMVLRAPADGQVTMLAAEPGGSVLPGAPVAIISPEAVSEVVVYLPDSMIDVAKVGAKVRVHRQSGSGGDRRLSGEVRRVATAVVEAPPRFRTIPNRPVWGRGVIIALDEGQTLAPGEAVTVQLASR